MQSTIASKIWPDFARNCSVIKNVCRAAPPPSARPFDPYAPPQLSTLHRERVSIRRAKIFRETFVQWNDPLRGRCLLYISVKTDLSNQLSSFPGDKEQHVTRLKGWNFQSDRPGPARNAILLGKIAIFHAGQE